MIGNVLRIKMYEQNQMNDITREVDIMMINKS